MGGSSPVLMQSVLLDKRTVEWRCCGQIWQLICSQQFPERGSWSPQCSKCGERGLNLKTLKLIHLNQLMQERRES